MKKIAVMQPYLFPYIGYYQLVNLTDVFIVYDDVTFIKRGYINRNSILIDREPRRFNIPVIGASQNVLIQNLHYAPVGKLLKTIEQSYSKAPYYQDVIELITNVLNNDDRNISKLNALSIANVFNYLEIEKKILFASELDYNREANRADRLIALAKLQDCNHYINSPGGKELYKKEYFYNEGIKLSFIESEIEPYPQLAKQFIPYLSMIDVLMNCSKEQIALMLDKFKLQ